MAVMSIRSFILDVCRVDSDSTGLFFWSFVYLCVVGKFCIALLREDFCDSSSQRGLAVVDVANGANVHVGFCPGEFYRLCQSCWCRGEGVAQEEAQGVLKTRRC